MIEWGWPQLVIAGLMVLGAGMALALHGRPRDPINAAVYLISTLLHAWLLYMGGFWS